MRPLAASLILAAATLAAAGCGERAAAPTAPRGDLVVLRAGAERTLTLGAGARGHCPPDSPRRAGARSSPRRPRARHHRLARRRVPGRATASLRLPGRWALPATVIGGAPDAATADGRTLVLARAGARETRFALVDASLRRPPRTVTLPGRFVFDAIAPDASRMFLIEPRAGGHYLVRNYDLVRDELMPGAVIDKLEGEWQMEGEPVARAVPAAAPWVYTLYRKDEGPFVHALNTEGFALCIDLPAAARSGPAAAREWGLVLAPGDGVLYAANPALGLVVAIDAHEGRILRTGRLPRGAIGAAPRLAVAPDGATLYVPTRERRRRRRHRDAGARTLLRGHRVSAVVAGGGSTRRTAPWSRSMRRAAVLRRTPASAPPAALAAVLPAR